ncbi:AEC family transporter [Dechloromonas denitrificans]|uniref:AEC family transporter n=1 Tax=Dechloromonas denitrificans TaxID=281362 RepID=UPI000ABFE045|nr:AEC family transporter [Dechloromonas denitrificans]
MADTSLTLRLAAILFPIFGIVAAGYFYARHHKPEMAVANRLNMDVFVPALVFAAMAGKSFDLTAYAPLALGGFIVLATCGLLAWPIARLIGSQPKTLAPPMMFNNSGNIGLPLAVLAWGEEALPAAVILFMVENTLHFSFGARLLDPNTRLLTLWRVPVVFAAIAGLTVAVLKIPIWSPLVIAIKMLGDVSVPLLLFSLGVRMTDVSFREWKVATGSAILRPLAGMLIAAGVIQLLGLHGREAAMLLVFGALPPAVLNFLFAERYKQEPQRVASIVLIGNLAALVFLPLALVLVL